MAIKITKKSFAVSLGGQVAQSLNTIKAVRVTEQARKGAEFQKAVAGGMSYSAQSDLLKKMIQDEKESPFSDPGYIDDLEVNLATTTKMARFETIRAKYTDALDAYVQDKGTLQSYIDVLQTTMASETDDKMRDQLRDLLSSARQTQAQNEMNAIQNRATVAEKDNSIPLLDKSIKEIGDKKAIAALNGNEDEVAKWDETLIALTSSKSKLQIENGLNDITFKVNKNNPKANDKLGYLNAEIAKADATTPVTYQGVTYDSLKSFWQDKQADYISNSYFDEVQKEMDAETAKVAATSNYGQIPVARIQAVSSYMDNLKSRPEFAPFAERIDQMKVANVNAMTTELSSSLYDEFQAKVQSGEINDVNYNSELGKVENIVTGMETSFGVKLTRQATTKEADAGQGISQTVNTGMDNLPVASSFSEKNAAEIKRAQDVYLNADKLAGTGKYVGQTADQVRENAHIYANSIRKGTINLDTAPPAAPATPTKPVVTPPATPPAPTAPPVKTTPAAPAAKPPVTPVIPPAPTPTVKPTVVKPVVKPTVTPAAPAKPAPAGIMYNGKMYTDQAAVDRVKAREASGIKGF